MKTLISVPQLTALLGSPGLAIVDCRFDLARPEWGAAAHAEGHIPGAVYAHLERDLSAPAGPTSGRHPLPAPAAFAARASAWGIDEGVQVLAYDQGNGMFAARLWWLLRWLGHERVAVLDGGLAAWRAAGGPLETGQPAAVPRTFRAHPEDGRALSVAEVLHGRAAGSLQLVDARAADRFAGENETLDPVPGHVPGALNHPFARNLAPDGRFLPPAELLARWRSTIGDRPVSTIVAMCGSGVTACHNLLALEHAGLPGARLYPGSWSEWIRDPARPVARGAH